MKGTWFSFLIKIDNGYGGNTKSKEIIIVIENDYLSFVKGRFLTKLIQTDKTRLWNNRWFKLKHIALIILYVLAKVTIYA